MLPSFSFKGTLLASSLSPLGRFVRLANVGRVLMLLRASRGAAQVSVEFRSNPTVRSWDTCRVGGAASRINLGFKQKQRKVGREQQLHLFIATSRSRSVGIFSSVQHQSHERVVASEGSIIISVFLWWLSLRCRLLVAIHFDQRLLVACINFSPLRPACAGRIGLDAATRRLPFWHALDQSFSWQYR